MIKLIERLRLIVRDWLNAPSAKELEGRAELARIVHEVRYGKGNAAD